MADWGSGPLSLPVLIPVWSLRSIRIFLEEAAKFHAANTGGKGTVFFGKEGRQQRQKWGEPGERSDSKKRKKPKGKHRNQVEIRLGSRVASESTESSRTCRGEGEERTRGASSSEIGRSVCEVEEDKRRKGDHQR